MLRNIFRNKFQAVNLVQIGQRSKIEIDPRRFNSSSSGKSAQEAVNNILYNTPLKPAQHPSRRLLSCLVQNEPGVLSRISGVLAGRGFNIDSIVAAATDAPDLSRMTIVLKCNDDTVKQVRRQLEDLTPVWAVLDYTHAQVIEREILLIRVRLHDGQERSNLLNLAREFAAQPLDMTPTTMLIQLCAKPTRIDAFMAMIEQEYFVTECVRSGVVSVPRGASGQTETVTEDVSSNESKQSQVDATLLPPG